MTSDNRTEDDESREPIADSQNLRERVRTLHEKVSSLDETLDRVEQTTEELRGESS